MPNTRLRLLVVDDEPSLRESFSLVFHHFGYDVQTAENGFAALFEIGKLIPDVILADLNMPGMSGCELLSVVRRRFPAIPVIAMSGAFFGSTVPSGVAADAFYQKGTGVERLLKMVAAFSTIERPPRTEAPIWISQNGYNSAGDAYVTVACPDCMRTFPQVLGGPMSFINETNCVYCGAPIRFAVAGAQCA